MHSLESPNRDDSNEYTHHYYIEDQKDIPKLYLFAFCRGVMINPQWLELPYLEQIYMVPKMFELLRFECN